MRSLVARLRALSILVALLATDPAALGLWTATTSSPAAPSTLRAGQEEERRPGGGGLRETLRQAGGLEEDVRTMLRRAGDVRPADGANFVSTDGLVWFTVLPSDGVTITFVDERSRLGLSISDQRVQSIWKPRVEVRQLEIFWDSGGHFDSIGDDRLTLEHRFITGVAYSAVSRRLWLRLDTSRLPEARVLQLTAPDGQPFTLELQPEGSTVPGPPPAITLTPELVALQQRLPAPLSGETVADYLARIFPLYIDLARQEGAAKLVITIQGAASGNWSIVPPPSQKHLSVLLEPILARLGTLSRDPQMTITPVETRRDQEQRIIWLRLDRAGMEEAPAIRDLTGGLQAELRGTAEEIRQGRLRIVVYVDSRLFPRMSDAEWAEAAATIERHMANVWQLKTPDGSEPSIQLFRDRATADRAAAALGSIAQRLDIALFSNFVTLDAEPWRVVMEEKTSLSNLPVAVLQGIARYPRDSFIGPHDLPPPTASLGGILQYLDDLDLFG